MFVRCVKPASGELGRLVVLFSDVRQARGATTKVLIAPESQTMPRTRTRSLSSAAAKSPLMSRNHPILSFRPETVVWNCYRGSYVTSRRRHRQADRPLWNLRSPEKCE